jgi:hypothetical protein
MEAPAISSESINRLRQFTRARQPIERCELCSAALAPKHRHLFENSNGRLACACDACALLFQSATQARYRLIPRDPRPIPDFRMSDAQWESLALPINLAFILRNSRENKVIAMYPSPAGATESLIPLSTWSDLARENPALGSMEPDIEALVINRVGDARDYFIAPIDACYELAGLIRTHWRGFSGGETVWEEIARFFEGLREQAGDESAHPVHSIEEGVHA